MFNIAQIEFASCSSSSSLQNRSPPSLHLQIPPDSGSASLSSDADLLRRKVCSMHGQKNAIFVGDLFAPRCRLM